MEFARRSSFRTGLKLLFVAAGLAVIQAFVQSRPSEAADFGLSELVAFPNPCRFSSRIRYNLTGTADTVQIKIYDMTGRHIRSIDGFVGAGPETVEWDLLNSSGQGVGNGMYLIQVVCTGAGRKTENTTRVAVQR